MISLRGVSNQDLLDAFVSLNSTSRSLVKGSEISIGTLENEIRNEVEKRIEEGTLEKSVAQEANFNTRVFKL